MTLLELIKKKNALLMELETAKQQMRRKDVFQLGSLVATLEGKVADIYVESGQLDRAAVNLISQASCLLDSNRKTEAQRIFAKVLSICHAPRLCEWVKEELVSRNLTDFAQLNVFKDLKARIGDNPFLRRPQIEAYFAAREFFSKNRGHAIIQLPVGCGKTGTMAIVPLGLADGRVLAVAPNLEILRNLTKKLDSTSAQSFLRSTNVLTNGKGPTVARLDPTANIHDCDESNIVVTNIQQLVASEAQKWLGKFSPDYFDMILLDEGHHNVAPTWQLSLAHFPKAKIASFTATPLRADGQRVDGERIYRFPIYDAIKEGYIKDIASRRLEPTEISFLYKGQKRKHSLDEVLQLREEVWFSKGVALAPECNEHIVDASIQCLNELRGGSQTHHQIIAVACSIDHAKSIRSMYSERNLTADVIHSRMDQEEQDDVRRRMERCELDAIVQVQMLGEGADYPNLSVAAIFRPFRHLVPYIQFVGRIMRVIKQNSPCHIDNRGFIVSHVGLNVDRWWDELREIDRDDQSFYEDIAHGQKDFLNEYCILEKEEKATRRRFTPDMRVIEETIQHFIQERFLPEDTKVLVDDLIKVMSLRGIDFETLGLSRGDIEKKLNEAREATLSKGVHEKMLVSPQLARKEARRRLDERVKSGAKQLLNELSFSMTGIQLPRAFRNLGATNNLAAAIILLNRSVYEHLGVGPDERDSMTIDQLKKAYDQMDEIIDALAESIRQELKK